MKRLVIAIDCDDVLIPSTERIVGIYNEQYGTNLQLKNSHDPLCTEWQAASKDVIRERIYDIQLSDEYAKAPPFRGAIETVRQLAKNHELHLVTARPESIMNVTVAMIREFFSGLFASVEHVGSDRGKGEVCERIHADVLIDDSLKHLVDARAHGVDCLLWFGRYAWNNDICDDMTNIIRCESWSDVEVEIERIASR